MYGNEERLKNWAATPDIIGAIHLDAALYGVPEKEMTKIKIGMATSEDDLKAMFQVNKALYGKLKTLNASVYVDIMDSFAAVKRSFNKE